MPTFFENHFDEIRELAGDFAGYWKNIGEDEIRLWIRNFREVDWPLALRLLQEVDYYSQDRVIRECQALRSQIEALIPGEIALVLFCGFPGRAMICHKIANRFIIANGMTGSRWNNNFQYVAGLASLDASSITKVVLFDDMIGSGKTITKNWENVRASIPGEPDIYIFTILGATEGIRKAREVADVPVVVNHELSDDAFTLETNCSLFSSSEKATISRYCEQAGGFDEFSRMGCRVAFYYRCPNNSLPIYWKSLSGSWRPILSRFV